MYTESTHEPGLEDETNVSKYLTHLEQITPEHIAKFRTELPKPQQQQFDSYNEDEQMVITALDYLTDKNLADLIQISKDVKHLVGFHNLAEYLQKIYNLTNDERYLAK